jgi:PAS domain S-box-containing protein
MASALRESEEKYRKQFDEALDAIFIADAETGILLNCNPAAAELVGREKPELIGQHQQVLHPPEETKGKFSRTFEQHLKEKHGQVLETHVITKQGELKDVAIKASLFEIRGKKVLQGMFRDITERKRSEEKLRESKERYHSIFTNVGDGLCITDCDGTILEVNPQMCKMHGYSYEELVGSNARRLVHPDTFHHFKQFLEDVGRGKTFHTEAKDTHRNGAAIDIEVTGSPINFGGDTCLLAVIRDITVRKLAENKIKQANEDLREQDRIKNEFVANVSHELRTPLAIFRNIISNLRAGVLGRLNRKQGESLDTADRQINRLARIISDFLDISKIEACRINFKPKRLAIQSIVDDVIRALKTVRVNKNVEIETLMPDAGLFINADYDRMVQVLTNLTDNAIKFCPDYGGRITIRAKDLGNEISVEVEDNGCGIPSDSKSKVFDRFVQLEKQIGPGLHGTGLGLPIAKELVEMHGGRIEVRSKPGQGTTFTVFLPLDGKAAAENLPEETDELVENVLADS